MNKKIREAFFKDKLKEFKKRIEKENKDVKDDK